MGAYTAFLDLSLAISGPVLGLVARGFALPPVFLATVIAALTAVIIAWRLADQKAVGRVEPQRR
jgi:hypothetical protein